MIGLEIRPSIDADIDAMCRIESECFSDPWSRESIIGAVDADASLCYTALSDGNVIGYAFIYVVADESEVLNIAVSPSHRRRGVGSALMKMILSEAERIGAATSYLEVRESNTAAKELYEELGFTALGKRKNYYRYPTEDAVLMAKVLRVEGVDDDNFSN